jgi:hypothetical protein
MEIVQNGITSVCAGGILADEMGLGKTVQICSFLERWKEMKDDLAEKRRLNGGSSYIYLTFHYLFVYLFFYYFSYINHIFFFCFCLGKTPRPLRVLLVLPLSLMCQWEKELKKWFDNNLVCLYIYLWVNLFAYLLGLLLFALKPFIPYRKSRRRF